jgi:hypothetical protein
MVNGGVPWGFSEMAEATTITDHKSPGERTSGGPRNLDWSARDRGGRRGEGPLAF